MGITIGEFLEIFINIIMQIMKLFEGKKDEGNTETETETPEA